MNGEGGERLLLAAVGDGRQRLSAPVPDGTKESQQGDLKNVTLLTKKDAEKFAGLAEKHYLCTII